MKIIALGMLLCICGFAFGGAAATAPTSQPATQPTETLNDMQAKLARLQQEEAELQAKIARATPVTATPPCPYVVMVNTMPRSLWPLGEHQQLAQQLREKWMKEHFKVGAVFTFAGSPTNITSHTPTSGKDDVEMHLMLRKQNIWGNVRFVDVQVEVEKVSPEDAVKWPKDKIVTVFGPLIAAQDDMWGNQIVILGPSKMKGEK